MLPPGAAHAACLALVSLPSMPALQARSHPSLVCAFCNSCATSSCSSTANWVRRRTRGLSNAASSNSQVLSRSSLQYSPLLPEGGSFQKGRYPFVAAASRWDDDAGDDDDGDGERGGARNRRTAPWEDIQWSNVPAARKGSSGGGRRRRRREEEEEEEEEDLSLGEQARDYFRSGNGNNDREGEYYEGDGDGDGDGDDDYMADGELQPRRRRQARAPAPEASEQRDVEPPSPQWNAGWFRDAQQANQGGVFSWARSLYNALFWYGGASEDAEQLPAMNFQDLLERFDSIAGDDSPGKLRPIVPPEDLGAEQDYRWRPSARDSAAAPEGRGQRRGKPKGYTAGGEGGGRRGAREERGREPAWNDDREQWPASREAPKPRRREEAFRREGDRRGEGERRERGQGRGGGGGGGEADAVAIGQLRRKQKQLADREHKLERDLEKVRERLGVVDATVELWLRRSAAMLSRGGSETDTEILQAKRRIYGLKDEGRQLDSARAALGERLEDCRAKLDRIVQELELLGEDALPPLLYEGDDSVFATPEAEGERGDEKADVEAGVAQMDDLRLAAEEQDKEVLPAVGEAEK